MTTRSKKVHRNRVPKSLGTIPRGSMIATHHCPYGTEGIDTLPGPHTKSDNGKAFSGIDRELQAYFRGLSGPRMYRH